MNWVKRWDGMMPGLLEELMKGIFNKAIHLLIGTTRPSLVPNPREPDQVEWSVEYRTCQKGNMGDDYQGDWTKDEWSQSWTNPLETSHPKGAFTLEDAIFCVSKTYQNIAHMPNIQERFQARIRNMRTGEIIPAEAL